MDIVRLLDILSAIGTVVCLNMTIKTYKAWGWYLIPTAMFVVVCWNRSLPGLTVMGIVLFFTGLKNYLIGRKKR
jgi:hypothetical protein